MQTRADGLGIEVRSPAISRDLPGLLSPSPFTCPLWQQVVTGDYKTYAAGADVSGALVQYPATDGSVLDYTEFSAKVHTGWSLLSHLPVAFP